MGFITLMAVLEPISLRYSCTAGSVNFGRVQNYMDILDYLFALQALVWGERADI